MNTIEKKHVERLFKVAQDALALVKSAEAKRDAALALAKDQKKFTDKVMNLFEELDKATTKEKDVLFEFINGFTDHMVEAEELLKKDPKAKVFLKKMNKWYNESNKKMSKVGFKKVKL